MVKQLNSVEAFQAFINQHPLAVVHVMRDQCSVCHAVLPQIEDLMKSYPNVPLAVINQSHVGAIAGELNIFTVPVDLIFMNGKELHRQGRFIDMQRFEHQLKQMNDSLNHEKGET
ncbi:thioredoxin family protein [Staphylococcus argenteus]|uniref:thioredoxin family protein n=1 Tax=Staphylococcus argenteus TaxID=985002 RepID=UPI00050820B1|nr:thioredoxin family protein [Staphylococcus argenteus]API80433.1 thiol reductase thioredoxin [Staphylococcus argenteus]MBE2123095.1 thioredoxin family protein [Staphylococcus argenteus]MBE2141770.1 thioredoxin family protein [Staphylococcus argenteus]MCG6476212.1 thioredoxin family protein [Staphylococcus argenteus]MCG9806604.1 thioredoxin family protein [Staphylococcus argenteus]